MNFNFIKINLFSFIAIFFVSCMIFTSLSYKLLINDFIELEAEQNHKNISTLLKKFNTRITTVQNIVNDYSKWDDTYEFIKNNNHDFIYENFRTGTSTLRDLDIDFIVFANSKNEILFSKFLDKKETFASQLQDITINKFKNKTTVSSLFKYKNQILYVIKEDILKSDSSGISNGYILSGKYIDAKTLSGFSEIFESIEILADLEEYKNWNVQLDLINNNHVKIKTYHTDEHIINIMQFYDIDENYLFSLNAENERVIVKKGKDTIMYLNIIISLILFILLYILYRNQRIVERYNVLLEAKVNRRTKQLNKSLKNLKEKNKELHRISNTDALTKIRNRRSFFNDSKKALKKAINYNEEFHVVIIDIDYFKQINDTYGHAIGDEVLINFTKIVDSVISKDTIFGRLGGEEFCISFKDVSLEEVVATAEEIRKKVEESILEIQDQKIRFTISLGLSSRNDCLYIDELLVIADELLYEAKSGGRNRLVRENIR